MLCLNIAERELRVSLLSFLNMKLRRNIVFLQIILQALLFTILYHYTFIPLTIQTLRFAICVCNFFEKTGSLIQWG